MSKGNHTTNLNFKDLLNIPIVNDKLFLKEIGLDDYDLSEIDTYSLRSIPEKLNDVIVGTDIHLTISFKNGDKKRVHEHLTLAEMNAIDRMYRGVMGFPMGIK